MDWLRYTNQSAIRNKPLSPGLLSALEFLPELGVTMEVFSGGETPDRKASNSGRHMHGNAADAFFYKDGRKLDWANPQDRPLFETIVRKARANGVTGIGAGEGYMRPGSVHIGFGKEAVWGAGGKGANAADWLRKAAGVGGSYGGGATPASSVSTKNPPVNTGETPMQQQKRPGVLSTLFKGGFRALDEEQKAKFSLAMGGLSMHPNMGVMQSARDTLGEASDARKQAGLDAKEETRRNQTRDVIARIVQSGQLTPEQAQMVTMIAEVDPVAGFGVVQKLVTASKDPNVQSSDTLPDMSGTVMTMRDGSVRVVTAGGDTLTGQAAMEFVEKSQKKYAENQRIIYGARKEGGLDAEIDKGGVAAETVATGAARGKANVELSTAEDIAAAAARGAVKGKDEGETAAKLAEMERNMPSLMTVVDKLNALSEKATYTEAGKFRDALRRETGKDVGEGAVARAQYIAMIDNQVLPLLKQTFGAAFTEAEGAALRDTLGDPDLSPAEKKAVLSAFIEQKKRDFIAYGGQPSAGGSISDEQLEEMYR